MRHLHLCLVLLLSCVSVNTFAASRYYMGASLLNGSGSATGNSSAVVPDAAADDINRTYSGTGYSFKMGMKFRGAQRLELSLTQLNLDVQQTTTTRDNNNLAQPVQSNAELPISGVDINYLNHVRDNDLRPYISIGAGLYVDTNKEINAARDDIYGAALNLSLGLLFPIGQHAELDFAFHGKQIYWQEYQQYDKEIDGFMATTVQTTSSYGSVLLGFNFIF